MVANLADAEVVIIEQEATIDALRAKLAECERERDSLKAEQDSFIITQRLIVEQGRRIVDDQRDILESTWLAIFDDSVPFNAEHLSLHVASLVRMVIELKAERDEARRWASAWKRSAKMWRWEAHEMVGVGTRQHAINYYKRVKKDYV